VETTITQKAPRHGDVELFVALTSGSEAGFTRFYQHFASSLYSLTCSILRDPKEAEDVLQEAFLQMWKQSSSYDPARSSLFSWAVMIARSRAIDRVRKRQRLRDGSEAAIAEAAVAPVLLDLGPDDNLMRSEERARVRSFLPSLPSAQREAIDLAFFGAMTQREISQKLEVPLGTVKARIRRGLMALQSSFRGAVEAA
jgi:RNA polymerase sigma-70 factor (ECF subfamily)